MPRSKPDARGRGPTTFWTFIRRMGLKRIETLLKAMQREELLSIEQHWRSWAHDGQLPPDDSDWRTWVILAGRGFGKTRAGAEWVKEAAAADPRARIALVGATKDEARKIMIEGQSGLLRVAGESIARWSPSKGELRFRNGAIATIYSGANPEGLRGPEHNLAWCDELAKWAKPEATWNNLMLGLRLGDRPHALITTTPRTKAALSQILAREGTVKTGGSTRANRHLPKAYIEHVENLYGGTRLGRQEIDGELLSDAPGQLWSEELLERQRLKAPPLFEGEVALTQRLEAPPQLVGEVAPGAKRRMTERPGSEVGNPSVTRSASATSPSRRGGIATCPFPRTVIGVDPPARGGTCGIVACARDAAGHLHLLGDHSVTGLGPEGWANAVADAAEAHGAQLIVAEDNQGGEMVVRNLKTVDRQMRVRPVTARLSKSLRAGPVAARFRAGKAWLHGRFPELEAELCGMIEGGDYEGPGRSPDRADAMVWALTELMGKERAEPRFTQV